MTLIKENVMGGYFSSTFSNKNVMVDEKKNEKRSN